MKLWEVFSQHHLLFLGDSVSSVISSVFFMVYSLNETVQFNNSSDNRKGFLM